MPPPNPYNKSGNCRARFRVAPSQSSLVPLSTARYCSTWNISTATGKGVQAMAEVQKPKSRLGRGLSSLISISAPVEAEIPPLDLSPSDTTPGKPPTQTPGTAVPSTPPGTRPAELPLDAIAPNPHQPRRAFDDAGLAELASSMKFNGVIQPIVVRQMTDTSGVG